MAANITGSMGAYVAEVVCTIFGKLDWSKIEGHKDSATTLNFLYLYLCTCIIRRESANRVVEFVKRRNWGSLNEDELARKFDGSSFVKLLKGTNQLAFTQNLPVSQMAC